MDDRIPKQNRILNAFDETFFSIDLLNYHNTTHYVIIISLTSEKNVFTPHTHPA